MKILHVIPSVASVRGGPSQAILQTVKALRSLGVDAEIITTNDNGDDVLDVPLSKLVEYKQVPIQFFPRFSPKINSIREFAFSSQLTAWLWQNAHRYDLLHVHAIFSYASTAAMAIARLHNIPYIVRPLGQLCEWSLQQSARKKQIYLNLIERANLNHSRVLHLTSRQEQQEVSRLGLRVPSFVLPHGLSIPPIIPDARYRLRQQLKVPPDEPVILFLSRLHPKKGLEYLIPALGKLKHHRFTFVLAGNGSPEYTNELQSLVASIGICDRTHFAGFVEGESKNLLMQGSDLFALTSHSENFGLAVLEALAAGLPVIITPGVALASVVEQHKLGYVIPQNISAIANALDDCLNSPQLTKQMGDRARQIIHDKYTWNHIASNLIEIYTAIIEKKNLPHLD
ncbi:glycosyltransferase [Chlorogloeopsis sp. ULAP01]|uniref:glycosyltransferase n=1 Tax=Chlorogloeopsis sp. ULAP01 TaxID=3056483 RepID=UPI0025AAE6F1|nr:glycosyltransferase [Chlorogloeopsis sp. ULAP01]MDM9379614.1 glycosyltransferase [Chlorogloeopsis sp. ULAP01]